MNAAVAIACLVGHEEGNPKLQLSEDLVVELLQVRFLARGTFQQRRTTLSAAATDVLALPQTCNGRVGLLCSQVLQAACKGELRHGTFWTVWKLAMGLASLTVNDRNKVSAANIQAAHRSSGTPMYS